MCMLCPLRGSVMVTDGSRRPADLAEPVRPPANDIERPAARACRSHGFLPPPGAAVTWSEPTRRRPGLCECDACMLPMCAIMRRGSKYRSRSVREITLIVAAERTVVTFLTRRGPDNFSSFITAWRRGARKLCKWTFICSASPGSPKAGPVRGARGGGSVQRAGALLQLPQRLGANASGRSNRGRRARAHRRARGQFPHDYTVDEPHDHRLEQLFDRRR